MSSAYRPFVSARRMAGLSLIELMIALVMGLLVSAGIITVFTSTSSGNKMQQQLVVLQEEGRFAINSLREDLVNANAGYCSNTGGTAGATGSGLYLDGLRTPTIYAKAAIAFPDNTLATMPAATGAYSLPSSLYTRGYDCTMAACTPVDPHTSVPAIPAMGTTVGSRVLGTDVLTIRYLKPGSGWAIVPASAASGSYITPSGPGVPATITLRPLPGEPLASTFTGPQAMLADCSNGQVFSVTGGGGVLTVPLASNYAQPLDISQGSAPRVFDFNSDYQTVTYYLVVADAGNGLTTGELVRRINGAAGQSLVRGIERMDFRYGVIGADGGTRFLTAAQVDSADGGAIACPPDVVLPGGMPAAGCLWRAVQSIEVNILMDGQVPLYTLGATETRYVYTPDGDTAPTAPNAATRLATPAAQGFPVPLLRREFTALVALRNYNP